MNQILSHDTGRMLAEVLPTLLYFVAAVGIVAYVYSLICDKVDALLDELYGAQSMELDNSAESIMHDDTPEVRQQAEIVQKFTGEKK